MQIEREPYDGQAGPALIDALLRDLDERYGKDDDDSSLWRSEVGPADVEPPKGVFLVARIDGIAVGCGAVKRLRDGVGEIKRMYVAPAARGRGIGRELLVRLEAEATALGYAELQLETGTAQPEAMALYESAGWARIPPYGRYKDSPGNVCYAKRVSGGRRPRSRCSA